MRKNYPPENKGPERPQRSSSRVDWVCHACGRLIEEGDDFRQIEPIDDRARAFDKATGRRRYVHVSCANEV